MNKYRAIVIAFLLLTLVAETFSASGNLPPLPDLKTLNQYYAQDIARNLKFLEVRPGNSELMIRISVLLTAAGQADHAKEWLETVKQSGIAQSDLDKLIEQARSRYNTQLDIQGSENLNNEPYHWITGPEKSALIAEAENNMEIAAQEYALLFNSSKNPEYLAKSAERYLWANKAAKLFLRCFNF